jgi:hypothetical protein
MQYMTTPTPPLYDDTRYISANDLPIDQLDDTGLAARSRDGYPVSSW